MIKLLWWLNYGEIIKWERVGILECHRNLWCIFKFSVGFAAVFFFLMDGYIMMLSLEYCRNHWKVKKVFVNVQNKRTDNFDLLKSLTNTCKQLHFFSKKWTLTKIYFKILLIVFQRYCFLLTARILRDISQSFFVNSRLHLTQLSSFADSKLINLWINSLNS